MNEPRSTKRSGWRRIAGVAAAAVSLVVVVSVLLPAIALAANDYTADVAITAVVDKNGDLRVAETRKMHFDGSYTRIYWDLDSLGSSGI